jgi:hypothetical protein
MSSPRSLFALVLAAALAASGAAAQTPAAPPRIGVATTNGNLLLSSAALDGWAM